MTTSDIQIRNNNGEFESIFPISISQGGTGATSQANACKNLMAVRTDSVTSTSKVSDAVVSQKSDSNQPIRLQVDGAAGSYLVYFTDNGTIGLWDVNEAQTVWSIRQYPVGSIYMSYSSTSPSSLFGGTWSQISGRFLYCTTSVGTGGNNKHTLTVKEMPSHQHQLGQDGSMDFGYSGSSSAADRVFYGRYTSGGRPLWRLTSFNGGGQAHNNMPAYQGVYCWRRTA